MDDRSSATYNAYAYMYVGYKIGIYHHNNALGCIETLSEYLHLV